MDGPTKGAPPFVAGWQGSIPCPCSLPCLDLMLALVITLIIVALFCRGLWQWYTSPLQKAIRDRKRKVEARVLEYVQSGAAPNIARRRAESDLLYGGAPQWEI